MGVGREPVAIKCRFINKVLFYIYIYIHIYIKKQLSVYIPHIYTHTYIYVKQQDCACGHCVCFAHTPARLWGWNRCSLGTGLKNTSEWRGRGKQSGAFSAVGSSSGHLSTREGDLSWKHAAAVPVWGRGRSVVLNSRVQCCISAKAFSSLSRASSIRVWFLRKPFFAHPYSSS